MRCFIAIEIPDAVRRGLQRLSGQLRQCPFRAAWVQPQHMHLTLRFLGNVSDEQRDHVHTTLTKDLHGLPPFTLLVHGTGAFPNLRRPSVIWAGVGPADGPLDHVQRICETAALGAGIAPEPKPFHPHVTIARVKERFPSDDIRRAIERERAFTAGEFRVNAVSLFKSELTPKGPRHTVLQEYHLT